MGRYRFLHVESVSRTSGTTDRVHARTLRGRGTGERGRRAAEELGRPDRADSRAVEKIRGLEFEHPVPVQFLAAKAFRKTVTSDKKDLTQKDKREIEQTTESLRALGLVPGTVDLFDAVNTSRGDDVLAYYDPHKKHIVVRGKGPIDGATKVTLAHELTHVLQDQHFDLTKIQHDAARANRSSGAVKALIEGDATWVQHKYASTLDATDRADYDNSGLVKGSTKDASVPMIIEVLFGAPYVLGPEMINGLRADGGRAAVDRAFRNPPLTDAQMLDPAKLILQTTAAEVAAPKVAAGEKRTGPIDSFGALALYLTLASRIPAPDALAAAQAWAGDKEITVRSRGKTCVRVAFVGRTPAATTSIRRGLDAWTAAVPGGVARVRAHGGTVELTACDPGAAVTAPPDAALQQALGLAVTHAQVLTQVLEQGSPVEFASCAATGYSTDPLVLRVIADAAQTQPDAATKDALTQVARRVGAACRARSN